MRENQLFQCDADNPAARFTCQNAAKISGRIYAGIVFNSIPIDIRERIEHAIREVYSDCDIQFFEDQRLPNRLFLYYVDSQL